VLDVHLVRKHKTLEAAMQGDDSYDQRAQSASSHGAALGGSGRRAEEVEAHPVLRPAPASIEAALASGGLQKRTGLMHPPLAQLGYGTFETFAV
jgi:hypothetical protein